MTQGPSLAARLKPCPDTNQLLMIIFPQAVKPEKFDNLDTQGSTAFHPGLTSRRAAGAGAIKSGSRYASFRLAR